VRFEQPGNIVEMVTATVEAGGDAVRLTTAGRDGAVVLPFSRGPLTPVLEKVAVGAVRPGASGGRRKVLVAGWWAFGGAATSPDDLAIRDVVCRWLDETGRPYDVAGPSSGPERIDWRHANPDSFAAVMVVGGLFKRTGTTLEFLKRFELCRLIGVHVSMPDPIEVWNPFDVLIEQDGSIARANVTRVPRQSSVPVVGIVDQVATPEGGAPEVVREAIERLLRSCPMAVVRIDAPRADGPAAPRQNGEFEALIRRMDVVVTGSSRGLVVALEHGVPAVALEAGEAESDLSRQAEVFGWPLCFTADEIDDGRLKRAFEYCLTASGRQHARACGTRGQDAMAATRERLIEALSD
jgi:hypothetical protein